eukprot:481443_1
MSPLMLLNEFNIKLCSPTSTTTSKDVAVRYAKGKTQDGIILRMNNNGCLNEYQLRIFDCSWISKAPEEHEVLMFGGLVPIKMEMVKVLWLSSKVPLMHLFYFQCMIDGSIMKRKIASTEEKKLKKLLHRLIQCKSQTDYQYQENRRFQYMRACFSRFLANQQQVIINIGSLCEYFGSLSDLIMDSKYAHSQRHETQPYLIKNNLYMLFPNLKEIVINSSENGKDYPINLVLLMSSIDKLSKDCNRKDIKVTVKAIWKRNSQRSWINEYYFNKREAIESTELKYQMMVNMARKARTRKDYVTIEHIT